MSKKFLLLALSLFLVSCIDQKTLLQSFIPKDDDTYARHFVELIRAGDYPAAEQMFEPSLRGPEASKALQGMHDALAVGEVLAFEPIGCDTMSMNGSRKVNLTYQLHLAHGWAVGNVYVQKKDDTRQVIGSHFRSLPDSLEVLNQFTLPGKSRLHYLVLAAVIVIPLFIIGTLIVCICTPLRNKWAWIIFILIGVIQFQLDWTSGLYRVQPVSFLLFGAAAARVSPYASWTLSFAIPLGAIMFLLRRQKLIVRPSSR